MEIEMEYLTQVISVLITLTQGASKREKLVQQQPHSNSSLLLLIELGTKQDSEDSIEMINNNNILSYFRKYISTLLTLSTAAIGVLILASPLLSNILLQPAQAQTTTITFKTPKPAEDPPSEVALTFDAQGTTSSSDPQTAKITNGTIQITNSSSGQIRYTGKFFGGSFTNNTSGGSIIGVGFIQPTGTNFDFSTSCSTSDANFISVEIHGNGGNPGGSFGLNGPVECSSSSSSQGGGGNTTAQQSSPSMTGTAQDSDSDGIPDSSDKCTHNSNPRCFKEGGDTSTATQSSTSMAGNQTR